MATAEQLMEIRSRRGPPSDPRQGRLLESIANAFISHAADVLSSTVLVDWCYGPRRLYKLLGKPVPSWHREMVKRTALKICKPIGRARGKGAGKGCPTMWKLDPARAELRSWKGRLNRKRQRQDLPPIDD
jgi:hypothetical protein